MFQNVSLSLFATLYISPSLSNRLVGLVVRVFAMRMEGLGFGSCLNHGDFSGSGHTNDLEIGTPVATCQAPGVIGSVLGLVGPVSLYCDCVR